MAEHLPECPQGYAVPFTLDRCICNELRAREEQSGGLITRQRAEQIGRNIGKYGCVINEQRHLPECPVAAARPGTFTSCICEQLRACEERVRKDQTDRCVAAFHDRISDSDLDDLISDDEKDIVAEAIRRAPQMP